VEYDVLVIGNEIDIYFELYPQDFIPFQNFFKYVKAYVQETRPELKVSTSVTLYGLTKRNLKSELTDFINQECDVLSVTYYPIKQDYSVYEPDIAGRDIQELITVANKPIYFQECGYQSAIVCNSSEAKQAEFFSNFMRQWDLYRDQIKLVSFYHLTDRPLAEVNAYMAAQNLSDSNELLRNYLLTLGLRSYSGEGNLKSSYSRLKGELIKRGW